MGPVVQEASPEFRAWWPQHEVRGETDGRKELIHPVVARMVFEHAAFKHAEYTEQRFVLHTPLAEEHTPAKMERLLQRRTVAASR